MGLTFNGPGLPVIVLDSMFNLLRGWYFSMCFVSMLRNFRASYII